MANRHAAGSFARPGIVGGAQQPAARPDCAGPFLCTRGTHDLLHGFIKKTQKPPQREIDLALKRKKGGGA